MTRSGRGKDNDGRVRKGPSDGRWDFRDHVWPYRHGKWWNWDAQSKQTSSVDQLMTMMRLDRPEEAKESLEFAEAVAQTALDRAEAADRRATTIAGSVAISASFTLSGAGLVLDGGKWVDDSTLREYFAVGLFIATAFFVLAAVYSLRALVSKRTRTWNWLSPIDMWRCAKEPNAELRLGRKAAQILDNFAANWEIADLKNRNIDNSLRCLIVALLSLTSLAVIAARVAI